MSQAGSANNSSGKKRARRRRARITARTVSAETGEHPPSEPPRSAGCGAAGPAESRASVDGDATDFITQLSQPVSIPVGCDVE